VLLELIDEKAAAGEKARRPVPTPLIAFIESELATWSDSDPPPEQPTVPDAHKQLATSFLRTSIERFSPTQGKTTSSCSADP
jgi:hypothetical protein